MLVARLFFRVTLGRRRTLWLLLLMAVPVLAAVYWRLFEDGSGAAWFTGTVIGLFLQLLGLGLPLYLGVSAVRDEIEDKTIVYLFIRPVSRAVILGGKIVSVVLVLATALSVDAALVYLVAVSRDGIGALLAGLPHLLLSVAVISLAVLVYTCLFSLLGALLRKPMVIALLYGFGWEVVASNFPTDLPRATLMYYLKSLLGVPPEGNQMISMLLPPTGLAPHGVSLVVLGIAAAVSLWAALALASRKEYLS
jgi:ABC-type transport system involved in multi-copper enzyme maturation permease subunit